MAFRHWKATMEYHKAKDILHVMHLLGHRSITNIFIYTQLISIQDDDYACKAAGTLQGSNSTNRRRLRIRH
jgi:hypothetical protein